MIIIIIIIIIANNNMYDNSGDETIRAKTANTTP